MTAEKFLGISVEEAGQQRAVLSMEIRADMLNGHDVCHGGLIYALAHAAWHRAQGSHQIDSGPEGVFHHAPQDPRQIDSGPESCSIEYVRPGQLGDRLTASAELKASGNHDGVFDVAVINQDGELVALFRGVGR